MASAMGGTAGYVDLGKLHDEMVQYFGTKGSKSQTSTGGGQTIGKSKSVVDRIRKKIVATGGPNGMHALLRVLKVMDTSGDDQLSRDELKAGLLDLGIEVSLSDMENLMIFFDRDHRCVILFCLVFFFLLLRLSPPHLTRVFFYFFYFFFINISSSLLHPLLFTQWSNQLCRVLRWCPWRLVRQTFDHGESSV